MRVRSKKSTYIAAMAANNPKKEAPKPMPPSLMA